MQTLQYRKDSYRILYFSNNRMLPQSKIFFHSQKQLQRQQSSFQFAQPKSLFSKKQANLSRNVSVCAIPRPNISKHVPSFIKNIKRKKSFQKENELCQEFSCDKIQEQEVLFSNSIKEQKKKLTIQIDNQVEKLRETQSTQCQSPKQGYKYNASKLEKYLRIRKIGQGNFGSVYLAMHSETGFVGALKIIDKMSSLRQNQEDKKQFIKQLTNQIKIQFFMNHPNLIKLYDCFSDQRYIYLFMELAFNGQLYQLLEKKGTFQQQTTSCIAKDIASGIAHMHQKHVMHRDLKLQNIVLTYGVAKICDFGWSVHAPLQFRQTLCGTPLYLSPQVLLKMDYTNKIDVWSIGNIAYELMTRSNPFNINSAHQLSKIVTNDVNLNFGSVQYRNFIRLLLNKQPDNRPTAQVVLGHPFITKYKDV